MANPEHLAILMQGVTAWNSWRQQNSVTRPDLSGIKLMGRVGTEPPSGSLSMADLSHANMVGSELWNLNISGANLRGVEGHNADWRSCNFRWSDLREADLHCTALNAAIFENGRLQHANLANARMHQVDCTKADMTEANLSGTDLRGALFHQTTLEGVNFTGATFGLTIFADVDLRAVRGLATCRHVAPSTIGLETLLKAQGQSPHNFLRGAGIPDEVLTYATSLVIHPIQFYSCFISYSTKDQLFADRLWADLQAAGVLCWLASEDLKIGDDLRPTFDEAIRVRDKLLLVLSEHSLRSPWVKREVDRALDEENRRQLDGRNDWMVLFPIRLDDSIFSLDAGWATDVRRRHIGDFRQWKDHDSYQKAFQRLLRDLKAEPASATATT